MLVASASFCFYLINDLALSINAGRNRLRAQHAQRNFSSTNLHYVNRPQPKKNNKKTEGQSVK